MTIAFSHSMHILRLKHVERALKRKITKYHELKSTVTRGPFHCIYLELADTRGIHMKHTSTST